MCSRCDEAFEPARSAGHLREPFARHVRALNTPRASCTHLSLWTVCPQVHGAEQLLQTARFVNLPEKWGSESFRMTP